MIKTFKYRLYPTKKQIEKLEWTLNECRELYNAALQERRDAWKICRKNINYYDQSAQLPELKKACPEIKGVYSQVLQDVLRRVDKAFQSFFRKNNGFPRFRSQNRYDSLTCPQWVSGFEVGNGRLKLPKIGTVKIKLHRNVIGKIKTLIIKRDGDRWYACFGVEYESDILPVVDSKIGLDFGLEYFATLSNGIEVLNPRWYQRQQKKLRRAQRRMCRRKKFGANRKKAVGLVRNIHRKIFNQRNDFQHKISRELINRYGLIAVEDLAVDRMVRSKFAKSIQDASWSAFIQKLTYKAAEAGRVLIKVDPRGTSQRCPCGNPVPKKLWDRRHVCDKCGLDTTRDRAAAMEILRLGLSLQASSAVSYPVLA